jgi:hypothetical protein
MHVRRLRWELVDLGATSSTKTLPQPLRLIESTLIRRFACRGARQAVTLSAAEVLPTVKLPTAATTF